MDLHPFLVHFPLGLLTTCFLFEILSLVFKKESLSTVGWWMQLAGTAGIMLATASGIAARNSQTFDGLKKEVLETHEQWALVATALFVGLALWRGGNRTLIPRNSAPLYLAALGVGVLLLWFVGWHGGELVFRYGAGGIR